MDFNDHPGFLGLTRGVVLHHGNWPAYPQGETFWEPLFQMSCFNIGTKFKEVDDIDRALLFVVNSKKLLKNKKNLLDKKNIHIAVWYEDLIAMQDEGFISGIKRIAEGQWRRNSLKKILGKNYENRFNLYDSTGLKLFSKDEQEETLDEEEDVDFSPFIVCENGFILHTKNGVEYVINYLHSHGISLTDLLPQRVVHLFEIEYYDTAIREACAFFESEIKSTIGAPGLYGDTLLAKMFEHLKSKDYFLESTLRSIKNEIMAVFKCVRNLYAHNIVPESKDMAFLTLVRIGRALSVLNPG